MLTVAVGNLTPGAVEKELKSHMLQWHDIDRPNLSLTLFA